MNSDQMWVPRSVLDTASQAGTNALRLHGLNATLIDAFRQASEVQMQAGSQALHACMSHFYGASGHRNPVLMVAGWAALIQANQQLTYSALKRNAEILASAQQAAMRLLAEGVNTNLAAAYRGSNQTGEPISERRTASVVIDFPNRRGAPDRTLPASDAEVKLSALIVS